MVAPGTALREGIDNIVHARTGGLIVIGDPEELRSSSPAASSSTSTTRPAMLYQVAKMDGAIVLNANATKITMANVQLMPDPTILSLETGTRHRTAERVSKQTDALVIAISPAARGRVALRRRRQVHPRGHPRRPRQGQPGAGDARQVPHAPRPGLDPPDGAGVRGRRHLHDVLTVLQRSELVARMAVEIERFIVELGTEGRLIEMQLEETMIGDRRRQGRAGPRLPGRGLRRGVRRAPSSRSAACRTRSSWTSAAWPSSSATTARSTPLMSPSPLVGSATRTNPPPSQARRRAHRAHVRRARRELAATDIDLEQVDGVGEIRAKEIREGLRRLQEINFVDRFLQT